MTLDELRALVRDVMQLDTIDLPDSLLDVFARNGFRKIVRFTSHWPWLEGEWTFPTVAGQGTYPLSVVGVDVGTIRQVRVGGDANPRVLEHVGPEQAEACWVRNTPQGVSLQWSMWADQLHLWPTPSSPEAVTVRGYRQPADFVAAGAGGVPDCPEDFHSVIGEWMLSEAYGQQEDTDLAGLWASKFADDLKELSGVYRQAPPAEPLVLAGGSRVTVRPFAFPWE